jgi:1,4-alpha-glucan branching enzyme
MPPGEFAIVLHTHMPYVEGFGTWPFGEEWLWEAAATSYVPLLGLLDELGAARARELLTLSLTPVLCDQLEAPGAGERCTSFLRTIRPQTRLLEIEELVEQGRPALVAELERSSAEYTAAADRLESLRTHGGLVGALGRYATWTSSATHAVLPLLALDASIELQLQVGIDSHRHRFGQWDGGFWLPECAHAPWLHGLLVEAGVHLTCVELTGLFGRGDARNLRPLQPDDGPTLIPIDRAIIDLVWGEHGYPARPAYRDSHRHTAYQHQLWANDGSVYDPGRAREQAATDAREFVKAARERVAAGGLCVCALDTELLGHWWYEGPLWLRAVIAEAERQGLHLTALNAEAVARHSGRHPRQLLWPDAVAAHVSSWGAGGDLRTWSEPAVADLAWQARRGELATYSAHRRQTPSERALRELLALQSSDWAFLAHRGWAGDYPRQRASGHAAQLHRALAGETEEQHVRNLAPYLDVGYS